MIDLEQQLQVRSVSEVNVNPAHQKKYKVFYYDCIYFASINRVQDLAKKYRSQIVELDARLKEQSKHNEELAVRFKSLMAFSFLSTYQTRQQLQKEKDQEKQAANQATTEELKKELLLVVSVFNHASQFIEQFLLEDLAVSCKTSCRG